MPAARTPSRPPRRGGSCRGLPVDDRPADDDGREVGAAVEERLRVPEEEVPAGEERARQEPDKPVERAIAEVDQQVAAEHDVVHAALEREAGREQIRLEEADPRPVALAEPGAFALLGEV